MDNVDLSGFCLDLLDLCRIDFSMDCPAGCWGKWAPSGSVLRIIGRLPAFKADITRSSISVIS